MPAARTVKTVALALLAFLAAVGAADAVVSPLLSSNSFISIGWTFGVSVFGTGTF